MKFNTPEPLRGRLRNSSRLWLELSLSFLFLLAVVDGGATLPIFGAGELISGLFNLLRARVRTDDLKLEFLCR